MIGVAMPLQCSLAAAVRVKMERPSLRAAIEVVRVQGPAKGAVTASSRWVARRGQQRLETLGAAIADEEESALAVVKTCH